MDMLQKAEQVKHLGRNVARLDMMEFQVDVASDASFSQPAKIAVPGPFYSLLTEIRGAMASPLVEPELASCIYFNIRDSSQGNGNLFSSNISFASLLTESYKFEGGIYRFSGGDNIEVVFSVDGDDTVGYAALAAAAKRWNLQLVFHQFHM